MNFKKFFATICCLLFMVLPVSCGASTSDNVGTNESESLPSGPYIGENGNWFVDGVDTGIPARGPAGEDGATILTGEGVPNNLDGGDGDVYIDVATGDLYLKIAGTWLKQGNIKGETGDVGETGISVIGATIDESGCLIITLSDGSTINCGQIVADKVTHDVEFYIENELVYEQTVEHGEKVREPTLEDIVIKEWCIDEECTKPWVFYGYVVTEDLKLYANLKLSQKEVQFDATTLYSIDSNANAEVEFEDGVVVLSNTVQTTGNFATLNGRGIIFNNTQIGKIQTLTLNIDSSNANFGKVYFGNHIFSTENCVDLKVGINKINLENSLYFTLYNDSDSNLQVNDLKIEYILTHENSYYVLPKVEIVTKDNEAITSKEDYVDCEVSIFEEKEQTNLKSEIRLRGNSTLGCPKKAYRIKLNKKASFFGLEKAKNWSLLADYMDASSMHNYTALTFANMLKNNTAFAVKPVHVEVFLNGENLGLYLFCEHVDEKEGRLDLEQEEIWNKEFDDINFYIERDSSTLSDPAEIENETFFKIKMNDYYLNEYVFALKYPKRDDFIEELDDGTEISHDNEFEEFFASLKKYVQEICDKFALYYKNKSYFDDITQLVDVQSLAQHAIVDQVFNEIDHALKSFKMYRKNSGKLMFGPNWDYDACSFGLPYEGKYIENPFSKGLKTFNTTYIAEAWGRTLFTDTENGAPIFKKIWQDSVNGLIKEFLENTNLEFGKISNYVLFNCEKWVNSQYNVVFDNQLYVSKYLQDQIAFLNTHYNR